MLKKIVTWIGTISILCQIFSPFVSIVYAETSPNQEIETILETQETQKTEEAQENKETQDEQEISEETIGAESLQKATVESAVNQETTAETEHTSEQRNTPVPEIHPEAIDAPVPLLNSGIRLYGQRIETEEIFAELRRTDDRLSMVTGETSSVEISPNAGVYWRIDLYSSPGNINLSETERVYTFSAGGVSYLDERVQAFNSEFPTVKVGDILQIFHSEAASNLRWSNNGRIISTNQNVAYFEITENGFELLQINHAIPPSAPTRLNAETSDDQLQNQAAMYLNLSNAPNVEVVGFTTLPDRSAIGRQSVGTIQVQERLASGAYAQKEVNILFNIRTSVEATVVPQSLLLGQDVDVNQAIQNVQVDGITVSSNQYRIDYEQGQDADVPGTRNVTMTVTHIPSGRTADFLVPITVSWGETLLFRGHADRSAGALAYLPGENKLVARRGDYTAVAPIHPSFPDLYYSLAVLRNTESKQALNELNTVTSYEAAGNRNVNDHVRDIGTISITHGDILKVYHEEPNFRLRIFNNEVEGALSHRNNIAYLELTPTGYRQVLLDRVTPRTGTISRNMTDKQLDQQAASYLNLTGAPNVEVVGFTSYPDRSKLGQTTGTIQVQKKLSNGNYVQMTYDVPFTVTVGLEATAVAQTLNLGETIKPSQVVKEVKYNGQVLSTNDFEVKISEKGMMNLVGSRTLNASITHKATTETIEVEIPVTIQWGNTLILKGTSRHESLGLSLIRAGNQLQLIGTKGSEDRNLQLHTGLFLDTAYLKIGLISGQQNIALNLPNYQRNFTYYGRDYKFDIIDDFGVNTVQLGDVVEVYHQELLSAGRMISLYTDGVEADIHPTNRLVNQTTYYETTNDGLRLLFINQLSSKNTTISQTMSDHQLDAAAETYLEFGSAKNVEVVGFTRYPDRSTAGQTTGTIQVQEKLSNGNFIQKEYEIPFTVQGVRMLTDVPDFDFGEIGKSSFSQMVPAKTENQTSLSLQLADFIGENNWSLQVYQSPFQDSQGNSLKGAGITLNNISVKSDQENALYFPESVVLDTQPTELLSYQAPNAGNDVMRGYTNIYFGDEGTAGVHLNIPSTTLANEDVYKTTISWELVADPSQGAKQYDE